MQAFMTAVSHSKPLLPPAYPTAEKANGSDIVLFLKWSVDYS